MTCETFVRDYEAILAGDASAATRRALAAHAESCPPCRTWWRAGKALQRGGLAARGPAAATRERLAALRERLRGGFDRAGTPSLRFSSVKTPIGRVFLARSPKGVCDVSFRIADEDRYRARLARRAPEVVRDDSALKAAAAELDAYFAGDLRDFSTEVDLCGVTPFTTRVLEAAQDIAFGEVTSYGELARKLGAPAASRAVGGALGRNPVPIIVPCHRVLQHGGRLGGYTGGLDIKRTLLALEGHRLF